MPAITAAASARTSVFGPRCARSVAAPPLSAGDQDHRERGQEPGDRPHRGRHQLRVDARHAREVGVLGRRLDRAPDQRAVEEPRRARARRRHDDEDASCASGDAHPERRRSTSCRPPAGRSAPKSVDLRVRGDDRERELRDADGRRRARSTRGAENSRRITTSSMIAPKSVPTTSEPMAASQNGMSYSIDEQREQARTDQAHVADREVDDAGRAVDQHDAHREQTDDRARR